MEEKLDSEGIRSEFNMSLESLRRVHLLFSFINQAPLDPRFDGEITPEKKFQAYMSVYEEVDSLMGDKERKKCAEMSKQICTYYETYVKCKNLNISKKNRFNQIKEIEYSIKLNNSLRDFGIKLRRIMQKHGYLYKKSDDVSKSILK